MFSFCLSLLLLLSAVPGAVFASEGSFYRQIGTMEELVSGEYVLICDSGDALLTYEDGWITRARPTVELGAVTDPAGAVWTLEVGENGIILRDPNGTAISPAAEDANGIDPSEYNWTAICTDGVFSFHGTSGETAVTLAQNGDFGFRAYGDALIEGNPLGYPTGFSLYALTPEEPEAPTEAPEIILPDPGEYVIWDGEHGAALSALRNQEGSQYYRPTALSGTEPSGYGNTDIWTLSVSEGTFTLTCGGETLGTMQGRSGISYGDGDTQWTALAENGGWYLQNAASGWYVRYDWELEVWLAAEDKARATLLTLTPAQRQAEPEPEKQVTAPVTMTPDGGNLYVKEETAVLLSCETEGAAVFYATSTDGVTYGAYTAYTGPLTLAPGFGTLYIRAYGQKEGWEPGEETVRCFTEQTAQGAGLYFGQLHAHSSLSDGLGTVQEAFAHAAGVENLDFLAVTDHSNSLDPEKWAAGKAAAEEATGWDFVAIYGYEMTWQEGKQLGHINTFNTDGFYSREQAEFSDHSTALPNYYGAVAALSGSISQFNHPGETFGDFQRFSHYSEEADRAVTLLELGGDWDVSWYAQALDAGWHVAPTYSQNNHSGDWGSADSGRTAVFADSLTEAGLYDALRSYRVYATQDSDLSVVFTLDGHAMGTQLEKRQVGDNVTVSAVLSDPTDGTGGTVEVIVEGGQVLARSAAGPSVSIALPSGHAYYFLRVTQSDGDVAVTAPIWIDGSEDAGILEFSAGTALPVQKEPLELTLTLYNEENCALEVEKIAFSIDGEVVHETDSLSRVEANGTARYVFSLEYAGLGQKTVTATVTARLDGQPRTYEKTLMLNFQRADLVDRVLVDTAHGNAGIDQMDNFTAIAAGENLAVLRTEEVTAEMLGNAKILLVSAPSGAFEEDFLSLVRDFVQTGGTVILCGQADSGDGALHTSAQLNRLLSAVGSSMRLRDDTARDLENHGDSVTDIFPAVFNTDSEFCRNITENQVYSHQNGCTVDPGRGTWLVKGHPTTGSMDADGDGLETVENGGAVLLAVEKVNGGTLIAAGSLFLADAHTGAGVNLWDEPYTNRTILENLLGSEKTVVPLSDIGEVRGGTVGEVFRIRGYVTAGTSNPYTTFPETAYLQDDTGGIALVPFTAAGIEIGTPMEVTGCLQTQNGNLVLEIMDWQALDYAAYRYVPETVLCREAVDYAAMGGQLVQVSGEVTAVTLTGENGVCRFTLRDEEGGLAEVLIEDGIFSGATGENALASQVKVGRTVRAMGLCHVHSDGTVVVRVRNCDEVVYVAPLAYTPEKQQDNPQTEDELVLFLAAIPLTALALVLLIRKRKDE